VLQQTVGAAVTQELGIDPGGLGVPAQIVHLALPLSVGEQGVLNAAGVPAVLLQTDGEVGPSRAQAVSELRLERFGRAALSALYALDGGPELSSGQAPDLYVQHKAIPLWGVRWVVGAMLLAPLLMGVDGLARLRRRGRPQLQTAMWVLSLGAPFWACAIFARVLGLAGTVPALTAPALPRALPLNASAVEALAALALIFAGAWLLHAMASARVASQDAGGRAIWSLLVLDGVAVLVWALNPYQALLVVGALHVWLAAMSVGSSSLVAPTRRAAALGLVALGLVPLGLVLAYYAHAFGMGPGELAWGVSVAVAGGRLSLGGALLWSLAFGSAVGTARAVWALASEPDHEQGTKLAPGEIVTRGPLTYAGPGSLGGTGSALRR
jgi:hypothetical protein